MKQKYRFILLLIILFSFVKIEKTQATHIIGGELSYRYLSNNLYEITLKIYRDCYNGIPYFDNPTYVYVFDGQNNYLGYLALQQKIITGDTLPLISPDSCRLPPNNVCVEEKVLIDTVTLPYRKDGYLFAYQRCCRNGTIKNIDNPGGTGTTYTQQLIMDSTLAPVNSSPYFKKFPPIFICNNVNLKFDHSAIDPDGDSLVYELCTPYTGADSLVPWPWPINIPGYNNYVIYTPPFDTVKFVPPYNVNNQLGGTEAMKIDPVTGLLTAKPSELGQYVVGISVKEYRNGVLLSIHRRDFQFNVTDCREKPQAVIPTNIVQCRGDLSVSFKNKSIGAVSYLWDFGDPASGINNTSTEKDPTHKFTALGTYEVKLISNPTLDCSDTAIAKVNVYNKISGANFDLNDACENTKITLKDKSILSEGTPVSWKWTINPVSNDTLTQKDTSYIFKNIGANFVKLKVTNENGCVDSITKPLLIYPNPKPIITGDTLICLGADAKLIASGADNYTWSPTSTLSCSTCPDPTATPSTQTQYIVSSTGTFNCVGKDTITVKIRPTKKPFADLIVSEGRCVPATIDMEGVYSNLDTICINYKNWQWDFGDGQGANTQKTSHTYTQAGTYQISLKFNDADLVFTTITLLPKDSCYKRIFIPNTFTPNGDGTNDKVYLRGINIRKADFRIYNRWGEEIFFTDDIKIGWDGTYKGQKMTPQVVVYVAKVTYWDNTTEQKEGNITLVE